MQDLLGETEKNVVMLGTQLIDKSEQSETPEGSINSQSYDVHNIPPKQNKRKGCDLYITESDRAKLRSTGRSRVNTTGSSTNSSSSSGSGGSSSGES
jgi:hypothetical protein